MRAPVSDTSASGEAVGDAIGRLRDLAKYLIGTFGAVGGLLVAGTQLSSVGQLTWGDDRARLIGAIAGLTVALLAVALVLTAAVRVLRPVDLSLRVLAANSSLCRLVERSPDILGGVSTVADFVSIVEGDFELPAAARKKWVAKTQSVVDHAAFLEVQRRFDNAWRCMLIAAAFGAVGVGVLAWAANPPADKKTDTAPSIAPIPVAVAVTLTDAGQHALVSEIGRCPQPMRALAIGGTASQPELVVTDGSPGCKPAHFTLDPEWGHTGSLKRAASGTSP